MHFSDVCKYYLGRWAQYLAVGSSLLTLLGGAIVYWILMTNFLYNVVLFIYRKFWFKYYFLKSIILPSPSENRIIVGNKNK
jgi:hypothetical protein